MSEQSGVAVIGRDTAFEGRIARGRMVDISGLVSGEVASASVVVREGGRFIGRLMAGTAEIHGEVQGEIFVKNLIRIGTSGKVEGKVQYGALEMAAGGELAADVRNVPPTIAGDGEMSVHRGRSAIVTRDDLRAVDPDDAPEDLTFTVARAQHGHIAFRTAPAVGISKFTQADLDAGGILFQHDGTDGDAASFEVTVADDDGASAAVAQTVKVAVIAMRERRPALL